MKNIYIPDGVTIIGEEAFAYCGNLTSIRIPDEITSIGKEAFAYCNLTSIIIPDSVTSIGDNAFLGCIYLKKLIVSSNVNESISKLNNRIKKLRADIDAPTPTEEKKNELMRKINSLKTEKSKLGLFKGKQKKDLQEEIDELSRQAESLGKAVDSEKTERSGKILADIKKLEKEKSELLEKKRLYEQNRSRMPEMLENAAYYGDIEQ